LIEASTVRLVDGEEIAENIEKGLDPGISPKLGIILVGDRKPSQVFVEKKIQACKRNGYRHVLEHLPEDTEQEELHKVVDKWNKDPEIHGIIVQLPLPDHINERKVFRRLKPVKDVDGLTPENLGKLVRGEETVLPSAVSAILEILETKKIELKSKNVTVINNSVLIGRPLSMALTQRKATVNLCHKHTENLEQFTKNSDIVVTATGQPDVLKNGMIPEDCLVIDASYSYTENRLKPDTDNLKDSIDISPVPGGVGPVTVAKTLENLVKCYRKQV